MNKEIAFSWANFSAFLRRPLTFFLCAPLIVFLLGIYAFRFQPTDPDLWWHLNVGRQILQDGLQFGDLYSYTMPGYRWVDHEWLLNAWMYFLYVGQDNLILLALVFGLATFIGFYLLVVNALSGPSSSEGQLATWLSLVLASMVALTCLGIRAHTVSLFGCAVVLSILWHEAWYKSKVFYWLLPAIFLVWANLHGAFLLGLCILGFDLVLDLIKGFNKERLKCKSLILLMCFGLTFINPYDYRLYEEFWKVFTDSYAHQVIDEWRRPDFRIYKYWYLLFYTVVYVLLLTWNQFLNKTKVSFRKLHFCLSGILFICALKSIRHIPYFVLASLPVFVCLLEAFIHSLNFKLPKRISFLLIPAGIISLGFATNFAALQARENVQINTQAKRFYTAYPVGALKYMQEEPLSGNLMAEYTWGGFISWYAPGQKVFIDGRMPSWKLKSGQTILQEFQKAINSDRVAEEVLQKYEVKYILLYSFLYKPNLYPGWEPIYKDSLSILLAKPEHLCKLNQSL